MGLSLVKILGPQGPKIFKFWGLILTRHRHTFDALASSPGIFHLYSFTGYSTVGGEEDLGKRLLLYEMNACGKVDMKH